MGGFLRAAPPCASRAARARPARPDALYTLPREQVPAAPGSLIAETLDPVDEPRSDVDTARARRLFAMDLEPCTERPRFPRTGVRG